VAFTYAPAIGAPLPVLPPQGLLSPVAITYWVFIWHIYCSLAILEEIHMAKEKEEKEKEERAKEEKPRPAGEQAAPKKKRSKLVFVLVVLMLLVGSAAGAYFFYGDQILERYGIKGIAGGQPAKKEAVEQKKGGSPGPILTLEPFIFNLAGNNSQFAKVSLAVHLQDAKAFEEAKKIVPVLRDKALSVLSAKSAGMLIDVNNRDSIKKELHEGLKNLFKEKDGLYSVYITDIIIP
jgi:flagellar basal body-associated protein FliL